MPRPAALPPLWLDGRPIAPLSITVDEPPVGREFIIRYAVPRGVGVREGFVFVTVPPSERVEQVRAIYTDAEDDERVLDNEDIISAFRSRGSCVLFIEGIPWRASTLRLSIHQRPAVQAAEHRPRATENGVAALKRLGHAWIRTHKRLPTAEQLAERLSWPVSDVVGLLHRTNTPYRATPDVDPPRLDPSRLPPLTPRQERIVRLRFGLGDHHSSARELPLEEVGADFDVTRERIRPIEASALRKLRSAHRATPRPLVKSDD